MANHRPKSLSELNNVYDKAIKAQRAIREGSDMLSDSEAPQQQDSIFRQLESQAAQAEKTQVYDPEIASIANDFIKRYTKPEPKVKAPAEIKRPAPSIKSFHKPVKQDVSLNMNNDTDVAAPATPIHRPVSVLESPEKPATKAEVPVKAPETPAEVPYIPAEAPYAPETAPVQQTAPAAKVPTEKKPPLQQSSQPSAAANEAPARMPVRARITSTQRSELMEEYLRVMSDEDDEPTFRKPKFNLFKKKKKTSQAEENEDIYSDYNTADQDTQEEIPVVAFDSSEVKYADEYSNLPEEEEELPEEDSMSFYDYVNADFDDEAEYKDHEAEYEDGEALDMSDTLFTSDNSYDHNEDVVSTTQYTPSQGDISFEMPYSEEEAVPTQEVEETAETEEAIEIEEVKTETEEAVETEDVEAETEEAVEAEEVEAKTEEAVEAEEVEAETEEAVEAEEVEAETEEVIEAEEVEAETEEAVEAEEVEAEETDEEATEENPDAPPADMVFDDIFSVTDADKRSYTGGNWSELMQDIAPEEGKEEDYYDYGEADEYDNDTIVYPRKKKGKGFLKFLCGFVMAISLLSAVFTAVVPSLLKVNSGDTFYDSFRAFSVSDDFADLEIQAGDLVITRGLNALEGDRFIYADGENGSYKAAKVTETTMNSQEQVFYLYKQGAEEILIDRSSCKGVVFKSVPFIGTVLALLADYYIFVTAAFAVLFVVMTALLVVLCRRSKAPEYDEEDEEYFDDEEDYSQQDTEDDDDDDEDYSDYDTDGIEQGLFSGI